MFAARLDHEFVAAPNFEQPDPLGFAAEQANGSIAERRGCVHVISVVVSVSGSGMM
jgi:hypothetical protein